MALDFPNSPTIGQTYTSGGLTWKWDGVKWTVTGGGGPIMLNQQVFTASTIYYPTQGMVNCIIECVGGGGGGGGVAGNATWTTSACGGGAGSCSRTFAIAAQIGASQIVTIGAAGTGAAAGNNVGGIGGDTSVGTLCVGKGGAGGGVQGGLGGLGGGLGTGNITGTGMPGQTAAETSTGTVGDLTIGGAGGSSPWGGGGRAAANGTVQAGNPATGYGAGGGGAHAYLSATNLAGGAGSSGIVIITEYGSGAAATGPLTVIPNYLGGLTLANDTTSANTVIDVAVGGAASDDNAAMMILPNAFTKSISGTWVAGSGSNGLDAGAVAASTWYHVFLIGNTSTGAVDVLISTSATAPTMTLPNAAGFTKKRRIGSIRTNASSQILAFRQVGDKFIWIVPLTDYSSNITLTMVLFTLTVPSGVNVVACFTVFAAGATGPGQITIATPYNQLSGPSNPTNNVQVVVSAATAGGSWGSGDFQILTNTASQISVGGTVTFTNGYITTQGWLDNRGK
jgi:hypothetical protein